MKIAIHHRKGSFSERWIEYCKDYGIPYRIVNAFDNNITEQLNDCDAFLWHYHHNHFKDTLTAQRILFSLEHAGISVFPNFKTSWHFDDKVAQKYLFESLHIPHIRSYIFYTKKEALQWAKQTSYPKVFKLKGGAGASNVMLVNSEAKATKLINKGFSKGFTHYNSFKNFNETFKKYTQGQGYSKDLLKSAFRLFIKPEFARLNSPDKGYIYFQDFIPNNDSDLRVIVIGDKAFAVKRLVRKDDFRASGSGNIIYQKSEIDQKAIETAFLVNDRIQSQCIAFDFVFDINNNPLVIEISYGFSIEAYNKCPGYWDKNLNWHQGPFNPQEWMIEMVINSLI